MREKRTVQNSKEELQALRCHVTYDELEVGKVYHVPPIITLERMDIIIMGKEGDTIKFKRIDDTKKEENKMHRTSVLSKFLIKRKSY